VLISPTNVFLPSFIDVDDQGFQSRHIGEPRQRIGATRHGHLFPLVERRGQALAAGEKQLDVLDSGDASKARTGAEASKLAQAGKPEGVDGIEDVDSEEVKASRDAEERQHLLRIKAVVGDAASPSTPIKALWQAAFVFAELFIAGDFLGLNERVESREAMNDVARLVENELEDFPLNLPWQLLEGKRAFVPSWLGTVPARRHLRVDSFRDFVDI
jgi:hypothetical protein